MRCKELQGDGDRDVSGERWGPTPPVCHQQGLEERGYPKKVRVGGTVGWERPQKQAQRQLCPQFQQLGWLLAPWGGSEGTGRKGEDETIPKKTSGRLLSSSRARENSSHPWPTPAAAPQGHPGLFFFPPSPSQEPEVALQ